MSFLITEKIPFDGEDFELIIFLIRIGCREVH